MGLLSTGQITIVDLNDGRTQYTHLAWCNQIFTDPKSNKTTYNLFTKDPEKGRNLPYIGIYQDFNFAGSDRPEDYTWSKWLGSDGANGVPGMPGADGRTPYIHFAYADSADGRTGFTTTEIQAPGVEDIDSEPTKIKADVSNKLYMGTYTDYTEADSTDPARYTWQKVKGADGANGVPGKPGADGRTPYVHFAYADSEDGRTGFTVLGSPDKKYMGTYTDFTQADSTDPTKYKWSRIKGEDGAPGPQGIQGLQGPKGDQGIPGIPGVDGKTQYTHIAYADNAYGNGFSQTDTNKAYIGMYQDFNSTDSTDPLMYRWTKWKGADGEQGVPGPPGANGQTPYVHFAYANSSDGRLDFSLAQTYAKKYIGTYTDYTQADSSDPSRYKWVSLSGDLVIGGRNLWIKNKTTGYAAIERLPENHITGQTECYRIESGNSNNALDFKIAPEFTSRVYTKLTMTAWVKYENVTQGKNSWDRFNCFKSGGLLRRSSKTGKISSPEWPGMFGFLGTSDWTRIERTYDFGSDPNYDELKTNLRFVLENTKTGTAWITGIKVEIGNTVTDYSLAQEDIDTAISSKADQVLTQEQINQLSERNALLKAELEAKASQEIVDEWVNQVRNLTAIEEAGRKEAEAAVIRASERISELQNKVGELKIMTEFVNTYMSQSEEGIIVGQKDGSSKVLVSTDRISFISGGKEVASISQGVLQIDNGVFVKSLRIGRFVTMQDTSNPDRNLTIYVGGN